MRKIYFTFNFTQIKELDTKIGLLFSNPEAEVFQIIGDWLQSFILHLIYFPYHSSFTLSSVLFINEWCFQSNVINAYIQTMNWIEN